MKTEAKKLWEELGNIPINEDEEIKEQFLHFGKGTYREEIWHWFEETFGLSVAEDLMFPLECEICGLEHCEEEGYNHNPEY